MDTPKIADFPDEMDRLAEWRRRRAAEEDPGAATAALPAEPGVSEDPRGAGGRLTRPRLG